MADPITLGVSALGMAASAGGSILAGQGAEQQAKASSQAYAYQASIASLNANLAKQNQEFAFQTGEQQALDTGLQRGQVMANTKTALADSGFDIRSGSAQNVLKSTGEATALDLAQVRSNAARTAYNYQVQGAADTEQSQMYTAASKNAAAAGPIAAEASYLGGITAVSGEWLKASQVGLTPGNDLGALGAAGGGNTSGGSYSLFG